MHKLATLTLAAALSTACVERASISPPGRLPTQVSTGPQHTPIKLHLDDGRLVIMTDWRVAGDRIVGTGQEFGPERELRGTGAFDLRLTEIALVEAREKQLNPSFIPLTLVSAASVAVTVLCAVNPKSCFGSCPTFYVPDDRGGWALQAEGFSSSIARIFEADDVDDLPDARPRGGALTIAMRNEALETHMIRGLSLLVVRGPKGSTVLRGPQGGYFAAGAPAPPEACRGPDVDGAAACAALAQADAREVRLDSDGRDLAARTRITLRFPPPRAREIALVLTARNSLMSTFVLYHMMALHGRGYGAFMAGVERGDPSSIAGLMQFDALLGGVDVSFRQGGGAFKKAGSLGYIGPIARATRGVRFAVDAPDEPVEVELGFARSHWKLDAARLAPVLAGDLAPVEVLPEVLDAGGRDAALVRASVRGEGPRLATLPGDEIVFRFPLPPEAEGSTGYFLGSRGYYHEWMREEWLRDEDQPRARAYIADPARALRELAAPYKSVEPTMEEVFRNSRFTRPARTP